MMLQQHNRAYYATMHTLARASILVLSTRAIELNAVNSDVWQSLGVVTTQLSPKVS